MLFFHRCVCVSECGSTFPSYVHSECVCVCVYQPFPSYVNVIHWNQIVSRVAQEKMQLTFFSLFYHCCVLVYPKGTPPMISDDCEEVRLHDADLSQMGGSDGRHGGGGATGEDDDEEMGGGRQRVGCQQQ
jgi:hypothetical protein